MAGINSYNLQGLHENFADWIATITPDKTPFISCLGIDAVNGTDFKWLADRYSYIDNFDAAQPSKEGDSSVSTNFDFNQGLTQYQNNTQIFRRIVRISDTTLNSSVYGRDTELAYQLAKASIDLKKEIEYRFLSKQDKRQGSDTQGAMTAGFLKQCAIPTDVTAGWPTDAQLATNPNVEPQSKALTAIEIDKITDLTPNHINLLTASLFNAGAEPCCIMYNPLTPGLGNLFRAMSDGDKDVPSRTRLQWFYTCPVTGDSKEYMTYTDNMGQNFRLVPNYWMPKDTVYIYSPEDWDMVVYREPEPKQLDSDGSYGVWLIECEVGLRHAHKFASGVIVAKTPSVTP